MILHVFEQRDQLLDWGFIARLPRHIHALFHAFSGPLDGSDKGASKDLSSP
jgi:hypothetical protein